MAFILVHKIFKFQSFWNRNKVSYIYDTSGKMVIDDIWTKQKSNSDFLRHFKFEFIQYCFVGSLWWCTLSSHPSHTELTPFMQVLGNYQRNSDLVGVTSYLTNILLAIHTIQLVALTLSLSPTLRKQHKQAYAILMALLVLACLTLITLFLGSMIFVHIHTEGWVFGKLDIETIVKHKLLRFSMLLHWYEVEAIGFIVLFVYIPLSSGLFKLHRGTPKPKQSGPSATKIEDEDHD